MKKHNHISRRKFLKGLGIASAVPFTSSMAEAAELDFDSISFDAGKYQDNEAQTILIYLYGGPSELAGNMSNIEEISKRSQNPYPLGKNSSSITLTKDNFWAQAGGEAMQRMLDAGDMNIFRNCYRTVDGSKAHGTCTGQAQRGIANIDESGMISKIASILLNKGVLSEPKASDAAGKSIPFVTMEGESSFFFESGEKIAPFLKPAAFGGSSYNPYERRGGYENSKLNDKGETFGVFFDRLSKRINRQGKIQEAFEKRKLLEGLTNDVKSAKLPEGIEYPKNNTFASRLEMAMKLLEMNSDTKIISIGSPGLGGWDDHSNAIVKYSERMTKLMSSIEVAMEHMKQIGRDNINIVVLGEFGRNVNYNNSLGWDHGNLQNIYWFGGSRYFNNLGVSGQTEVYGGNGRVYQRPKGFKTENEAYNFQIFSVAATIYNIYGITNPEVLTGGNEPIQGLLS